MKKSIFISIIISSVIITCSSPSKNYKCKTLVKENNSVKEKKSVTPETGTFTD